MPHVAPEGLRRHGRDAATPIGTAIRFRGCRVHASTLNPARLLSAKPGFDSGEPASRFRDSRWSPGARVENLEKLRLPFAASRVLRTECG